MTSKKHEPYKIFEFGRIDLSKDDIAKFPANHLRFIGQSCLATNDISLSLRVLIGHYYKEGPAPALKELSALTRVIVQRQLQAKIFEFVKLMADYEALCRKNKDIILGEILDEISASISEIKNSPYYALSKRLRNQVTNHYAFTDWHAGAKSHKPGHKFSIYMHRGNGNSFYPFAEELSHLSLLQTDENGKTDFEALFRWSAEANRKLIGLQQKIMLLLFRNYLNDFRLKSELAFVPDRLIFDEDTRYPLLSMLNGSGRW